MDNAVVETAVTTQQLQQPVFEQPIQPPPVPTAPTYTQAGYPMQPSSNPQPQLQQPGVLQPAQPHVVQAVPTYVCLPNGQLQLIQIVQQPAPQTVYVQPPAIIPAKTNEEQMQSFLVAQILVMMTNIAFSGICVGYLAYGLDECKDF